MSEQQAKTITRDQKWATLILGVALVGFGSYFLFNLLTTPPGLFAQPQSVTLEVAAATATVHDVGRRSNSM